jgi:hypothetical protein
MSISRLFADYSNRQRRRREDMLDYARRQEALREGRAWEVSRDEARRANRQADVLAAEGRAREAAIERETREVERGARQDRYEKTTGADREAWEKGVFRSQEDFDARNLALEELFPVLHGAKSYGDARSVFQNVQDAALAGRLLEQQVAASGQTPGQLEKARDDILTSVTDAVLNEFGARRVSREEAVDYAAGFLVDAGMDTSEAADTAIQVYMQRYPSALRNRQDEIRQGQSEFERGMYSLGYRDETGVMRPDLSPEQTEQYYTLMRNRVQELGGGTGIGDVPANNFLRLAERAGNAGAGISLTNKMAKILVENPDVTGAAGELRGAIGGFTATVEAGLDILGEAFNLGDGEFSLENIYGDLSFEVANEIRQNKNQNLRQDQRIATPTREDFQQAQSKIAERISIPRGMISGIWQDPQISNLKLMGLLLSFHIESGVTKARRFSIQAVDKINNTIALDRAEGKVEGLLTRLNTVNDMFGKQFEDMRKENEILRNMTRGTEIIPGGVESYRPPAFDYDQYVDAIRRYETHGNAQPTLGNGNAQPTLGTDRFWPGSGQ